MTAISLWAPRASAATVKLLDPAPAPGRPARHGRRFPMTAADGGWFHADVPIAAGQDYGFLLDEGRDGADPRDPDSAPGDERLLPDPRSRRQPYGVHGPSRWHDPGAFAWSDQSWTGRALAGAIIYELHIGTFTAAGTFDAAIERLPHLVSLGVTHVEVLPINSFNGQWNWGYDGVAWYAAQESYGGPDGFARLVDACHRHGIAVLLDVVYNHLGPSGNYLPSFGPYLREGGTAWGDQVNLDGAGNGPVRRYIIDNALMWLTDFHVDGLRLDAVHALSDQSPVHLLEQLAVEVDAAAAGVGRPLTLIAESDLNDPKLITPRQAGGYGLDGQWDDDVHHCLHALLTGERQGYYADFGSIAALAKAMTGAFFHDGTFSSFRGRLHGRPVDRQRIAGYRFVVFLQDHDQVGNRATGDRLPTITDREMLRIGAMLLLTGPFTPMLWMGEEWGAATPWQFFTSHPEPELGEATARGRIAEFTAHGWDADVVPDPQDPHTFERSKLDWAEPARPQHAELLQLYGSLIALRRARPELADPRLDRVAVDFDEDARWLVIHRGRLRVAANLSETPQVVPLDAPPIDVLLATDPGWTFGARLGGTGRHGEPAGAGIELPGQCAAIVLLAR
jgi:maltooligosyltrehalose trehalohydrolase